jgi:hypothetical protein
MKRHTMPARDWRMLLALLFLGGGGIASTVLAWHLARLTAELSSGPWPLAYALYGTLGLIGVVLTGFSYVLGKRAWKFSAGAVSGETSGGDDTAMVEGEAK